MKRTTLNFIVLSFFILTITSCHKKINNKLEKELKKIDLANLTLNEDITNILSSVNLSQKDTIKSDALTLMGNERLVFDSEKLLVFNKIELENKNSNGTNSIIFHYGKIDPEIGVLNNEKNNIVGMYQINLYSENEIQNLLKKLNLILGKATFEKERNGNVSDIKDNTLIETKEKFKENTFIWKNKNLIYYCFKKYLSIDKNQLQNSVSLFVFNKNNKEWIGFISGLGYQYTENCLNK